MAQPQLLQIKLSRFDAQPWGFRLQGGTDFAQPLLVQKVNAGSLSEQAGLQPGDAVVKINDVDVFNLRHKDAQDIVVRSGNNFVITVQRGGSTWRPHVTPTGNVPQPNSPYLQTVTKTSLAHKQQDSQHIGCGYNNAARPFSNGGDGGVKSIVNKQYNTPVGIYSDESIAETLSAQAEVLAGGVLGVNFKKNEKEYQGDRSEVLKFLREEETGQSTPAFGNSHYEHDAPQQLQQPQQQYNQHQQHYHQQQQQQQSSTTRHVSAPVNSPKPPSTGGLPTGQNICTECERLITGVFVRIKDKNLHVECFKCATCGTSLKNQGYYNFNNKLYCDIHAKQAAINNPPTGTEGYVPVPIKPNTKLSASTISSALNSHGYGGHSNGYSNGNSTPAPAPVNQGYARPFGAAAPKSPVSYPPQQQQQSPRPAPGGQNPYATLPRSNVGQQVPPANTSTAFAPAPAPAPTSIPVRPSAIAVQSSYCSSQFDVHELIEETAEELEHSEVLFPPPSPLSHLTKQGKAVQSGLHKADSIPKYQRNWTVLPTQSPIRTPEPQELRENVPLAFVDAPKAPVTSDSSTVHRPIAQVAAPTTVVAPSREREKERRPQLSVPIIVEDRSGPVTMAFQPLDELVRPDQALTPTRPYTPSLTNKPAPIVPFYQTEEKLVFEECSATHARNYNELNASPFPDRTRSPAPGPPPNPLNAIRAPRMKEPETKSNILSVSGGPRLQTGSITTGQSYQGQLLAHSEQSSQSASQSYNQQPERITEQRVGNLNIQQREQSSQLQQQAQSQTQSQTRSQVGNTQIERRRKVTEEFERTQSAKTIEIRTGSQSVSQSKAQSQSISQAQTQAQSQSQNQSDTERRSSYGKTGFVASQAKRLSCMEEEISSLTSQSQAISARASALGEGCFPNLRSPTFDSKFPLKPAPAESIVPGYATVPAATKMLTAPPPGFLQQQQQQQQRSAFSGYQATTSSVQQSSFASSSKATTSSLSSSSASASASASVARSSQSLTQASAITTTTNNQATTAYRSSNGSITKPNLASRPSIASITAPGSASAPAPVPSAAPTKATAPFKAPIVPKSVIANAVNAAAPPAPAVFPPDLSDLNLNSNVDNSPGAGGKSAGAFGATSAPKRGRGILNKAAGPGVRIPLCNSCNVQIRGPFITALGRIWCPDHFICVNGNCRRPLQDIGFVEEKGDLYCEYCFEKYLAPTCSKCAGKIKGDCLNAIGKHFHPECFTCGQCGKIFGNRPFFLEDGNAYCEADWNELFTTKCFACGFPVEAGDRWVEALNHNYHSQCFNCTFCKQNLEGQSFYNKGGRPFCKNHAR
uniref:Z band alternatively spliced PDZ-motif protein 52, isoform M n=1 Tax=Drosophila melanogaster TaxID=7227 RepID=A0A0B4KEW3_DROME|nr:Z band alternatively spliced PDZ-motif protein 52, isoform M [Drosophila melanogaster]AGB93538.1 Z band alternatively spliced PDZ-motif protein 52, isoform M [Drosophila melanogaster]|eukprot:NP_001261006.1 Z band alternatively spliced PDZ-motif protein 52, isoform M [Drosophila melanogaster]